MRIPNACMEKDPLVSSKFVELSLPSEYLVALVLLSMPSTDCTLPDCADADVREEVGRVAHALQYEFTTRSSPKKPALIISTLPMG